jgi:hypothetical protein
MSAPAPVDPRSRPSTSAEPGAVKRSGGAAASEPSSAQAAPDARVPKDVDWEALRQTAAFLDKARLAEWVAIMNNPRRSIWINFVAGVARGVGMVVGASIIGVILMVVMITLLKKAFIHAGGVPWVGTEMKEAIGFILRAIRERQAQP